MSRRFYLYLALAGSLIIAGVAAIRITAHQSAPVRVMAAGQPADFTQFFDGQSHPLSARFTSLDAARAIYPAAKALTDEEFPLLLQKVVDDSSFLDSLAGGISAIDLPAGVAQWDRSVNLRGKSILIRGQGSMQTALRATKIVPYFLTYPVAHVLPTIIDGPSGEKALKLNGTMAEGSYNLSDIHFSDFTSLAGVTFECWVKLNSLPGEWDLRSVFTCGGSLDGTTATHNDITAAPFFFTVGGVTKVRLFAMQDGTPSYSDFPVTITVGDWFHFAVTLEGATRKVWVGGQLVGTHTGPANQIRQPWEDITVGMRPAGGWPEGWPIEKVIDGAISCFRVSNKCRYTAAFTPPAGAPAIDGNTICTLDLGGVDGITAGVSSVYGKGQVLWRYGDYAGDTAGSGISGMRFVGGTFGLYAYGLHNSHLHDLSSFMCRYPIFLRGHSFQNQISNVNFQFARNGITTTQISDCSIYNAQISYSKAFAVVSKESKLSIRNSWFYSSGAGNVLAKDTTVSFLDSWTTDEAQGGATTFGALLAANCAAVSVRNCYFWAREPGTPLVTLWSCHAGSIRDTVLDITNDVSPELIHISGNAPRTKFLTDGISKGPIQAPYTGPLTNKPQWVKSLDEVP